MATKEMATKERPRICVNAIPRAQMLKEKQTELRKYEIRYEMSSEDMAKLLELDAIRPTAEVLIWYSTYYGLKYLLEETPTVGTPGTTTEPSTKSE